MKTIAAAILGLMLAGCASVSVKDEARGTGAQPKSRPNVIYVADYDFDGARFQAPAGHEAELKAKTQGIFSDALVKFLGSHAGTAQHLESGKMPATGWLVKGRFLRVNTGNRAARMLIGLGAGGTKMETETMVYDLASPKEPFLRFKTTGGSNAMPGAIPAAGPTSSTLALLSQAQTGITDDSKRTARMITGEILDYMVGRGWIGAQALKAKKLGEYQVLPELLREGASPEKKASPGN